MKGFYFLLWQFLNLIIAGSHITSYNRTVYSQSLKKLDRYKRNSIPEELFIRIQTKVKETFDLHLRWTDQLLANHHLPIWSVRKTANKPKFYEEREVMKKISGFTLYHDYITKSSAVYFHKTGQLDGVIDTRYYIRGLPINELNQIHNVNDKYIFDQTNSVENSRNLNIFNQMTRAEIGMIEENLRRSNDYEEPNSPSQSHSNIAYYPELLVVISHDVFNLLRERNHDPEDLRSLFIKKCATLNFSAIISYVLTFYNAADMLYRLIEAHTIKLNIAAIVIEVDQGALNFVESPLRIRTPLNDALLGNPVLINLMTGFEKLDDKFPADSYDFIIYTTTQKLTKVCPGPNRKPRYYRGFTSSNLEKHPDQVQTFKHTSIIIRDDTKFKHFVTVAHEIAHAMTAGHDPVRCKENGICDNYIMTPGIDRCVNCLKWSEKTKIALSNYFRSPAHCILRNYPRSLFPKGPRIMLTSDEQYQCHGYPSSCKFWPESRKRRSIFSPVSIDGDENKCKKVFVCLNGNNIGHVFRLMDGTPCGSKKVCWNAKCLDWMN